MHPVIENRHARLATPAPPVRLRELVSVPDPVPLPAVSRATELAMRFIDVTGALLLMLVFAPVILAASILVKLTSAGPVIFRQDRVGKGGESFVVLKFRTMADGTHEQVLADPELRRLYEANDFKLPEGHAHITGIGKWLRKTSLDELPQLMNVLRGEMGLVGVRPIERDQLVLRNKYDRDLYCMHRPALTGLWQVEGRSTYRDEHRVDLDRRCLEAWGISFNLKILARTPSVVLGGVGAH